MTQTDNDALVRELLPCPFCGSDELSHGWSSPGYDGSPSTGNVECHNCNALIYSAGGESSAITAWNTRSTPQPKPLDPPAQDEVVLDALRDAYWAGALAVHNAWVNDLGQNDPDFGEAASDYAQAAITALRQHQSAEITRLRTELAEAHQRGVKAGLDAAARVADGEADAANIAWEEFCDPHDQGRWFGADQVATAIRAIDPASVATPDA